MKIYFVSDHAGFSLRQSLLNHVQATGYDTIDLGPTEASSVDYPDFAVKLAAALLQDCQAFGVAICGSGVGISIALNRFSWVRAAPVSQPMAAALSRQHNNANVLVLGERLIDLEVAKQCADHFFSSIFEGGRHQRRVDKLSQLGEKSAN